MSSSEGYEHTNSVYIGNGRWTQGGDCLECSVMWPCPTEVRRRTRLAALDATPDHGKA